MLLQGEIKDTHHRELPKQEEPLYGNSANTFLKSDASTGRHYYDLNAAMQNYRGPWLFGHEHVEVFVGRLKAQWEQFCPVPADLGDGILMKGNVVYRQPDGSWRKSNDAYEGVLRTKHGLDGGRYFLGRTQHTFFGRNFPNGRLTVEANLNIHLNQHSAGNPLIPVPARPAAQAYTQSSYTGPSVMSYPEYDSSYGGSYGSSYGGGSYQPY